MERNGLQRTAAITRSGLRRYPRELMDSLRAGALRARQQAEHLGHEAAEALWPGKAGSVGMAAMWLGHATAMVRIGGVTVLTDPVFSHRVGLTIGPVTFGVPRIAPLPVDPATLPRIDLILLSHAHFDHFDRPTLKRLASRETAVVTARATARMVPAGFGDLVELDWDREVRIKGVTVRAMRPVHWGARMAWDRHRGFNSYVIEGRTGASGERGRVVFGGDTARTDCFRCLRDAGEVDLAILGIGSYEPWIHRHANPEQVWEMFQEIRGERSRLAPMHHSTFKLGEEGPEEPMRRLLAAAGTEDRVIVCREMGEVWRTDGLVERLEGPMRAREALDRATSVERVMGAGFEGGFQGMSVGA